MKENIAFSIIMPVYNTEKYLPQCIDSLLNQTFGNFELIIINDGSTDNSQDIIEKYAQIDSRIVPVLTEHIGAGAARNLGIEKANGEYLCFVDSDDSIERDFLYLSNKKLVENPDILIFGIKTYNLKTNKIYSGQYSSKYFESIFKPQNLFKYHTIACNKIFRKSFLKDNNIEFSSTQTGEDQIFVIKSLILAKSIKILKKDLYIYHKYRENSLTNCKIKKDFSPIYNFYLVEKFLNEQTISLNMKELILSHYLKKALFWYAKTDSSLKEDYFNLLNELFIFASNIKVKGWWDYYKLSKNRTNLEIRLAYLYSIVIYIICERFIFIPACLIFSIATLLNIINRGREDD